MTAARLLGLQHGPDSITLVRHGQSVGNVADEEARRRGADRLELAARDADVELSPNGEEQADALGRWLKGVATDEQPTYVLSSPYRRAADTARRALADLDLPVILDERLRERDLGLFDGLTGQGIRAGHADEAERRRKVGKFYYQPPSGESWADVALRVRSLLADLRQGFGGERVWMFTHQAVIMSFRYVLEGLDEARLLEIDRTERIANASMTTYRLSEGGLTLAGFADAGAVETSPADVTREEPAAGRAPS